MRKFTCRNKALVLGVTLSLLSTALTLSGCQNTGSSTASPTTTAKQADSTGEKDTADKENSSEKTSEVQTGESETKEQLPSESEKEEDQIDSLSDTLQVKFTKYERNTDWEAKADTTVTFSGSAISATGKDGYIIEDNTITITKKGTYVFSGTLDDGQIIVNLPKDDNARLVMNGVNITCRDSAPVFVQSGNKVVLLMADGSENFFTDSAKYTRTYASGIKEPNACIFSTCDLSVNGTGKMVVKALFNNGIGSKDDLKVLGATLDINAFNHGLKGNDSVVIAENSNVTIDCGNDGIKSDREDSPEKGFIYIKDGTLNITCTDDALQAFNAIIVRPEASLKLNHGGKTVNCSGENGLIDVADSAITE